MQFLVLFAITAVAMTAFAWLLIICRRRLNRTRHGLSGMCHRSGETICSSCRQAMDDTTCTRPQAAPRVAPDPLPAKNDHEPGH